MRALLKAVQARVSGERALRHLAFLTSFHRIQASPDYRRAAEQVAEWLRAWGLHVEWHEFPAREGLTFWHWPSFQCWWAEEGWLDLISPEHRRLADWEAVRLSLVPRSVSWEGEAELVHVPDGTRPEDYEGVDVAGKVVLTRAKLADVVREAVPRGAVAYVYYGMREVPPFGREPRDAVPYTSFWYWNPDVPRATAFAVSPRTGEWLAELCEQARRGEGNPPRVRGRVRARLYDGTLEVVSATIPGQSSEEVLVVSHLCHPTPFANDNTSGVAANLETARVLAELVREGALPPLKRTVRFLWMPEMTGTMAYLAAHQQGLSRLVCGLNLDMVGERQDVTGSVLLLEHPSEAAPGFTAHLVAAIRDAVYTTGTGHASQGAFPLARLAETPFNGGSDHYILSDPTVGADTPMLIQWPDRFYHTTADTLDKVDPQSLANAAATAATFAAWAATAGRREAEWLAWGMQARWQQRFVREAQALRTAALEGDAGPIPPRARLAFLLDRHLAALDRLRRLAPDLDVSRWRRLARQFAASEMDAFPDESFRVEADGADLVPVRQVPGPVPLSALPEPYAGRWRALSQDEREANTLTTLALYWADGRRTVDEIATCVALETGRAEPELIRQYFELLAEAGKITLRRKG